MLRGLLPPTAKSLVKLYERGQHVSLRLGEFLFGSQPLTLGVEHFQVAADAAFVTGAGEPALVA